MKRLLIVCTGNSCRSIMAEALIKKELPDIAVKSAGSKPAKSINPNAKKVLEELGYWEDGFYPKSIETFLDETFDLVVTVCDNAKESCPILPKNIKHIHIGFEDPDGKDIKVFKECFNKIKNTLLPQISNYL